MDELELVDLYKLFSDNIGSIDWERVDFIDPPYCWTVVGALSVGGYDFDVGGTETSGEDYNIEEVWAITPGNIRIKII